VAEDQDMSVAEAAAVVADARRHARHELVISAPAVFLAWGLVWLVGYGAMWLSVRGQHPYRGPSGVSIAVVLALAALAAGAVLVVARRAATGIGGQSARYRRIVVSAWATGYVILLLIQAGISGSVSARALAFVGLAGPLLLAGLIYILASVLGRDRPAFILGAWLVLAAVSCAWLTPAAILATCALAGGGAFLLIAVIQAGLGAHAS
jgi:hypothetical protein